MPMNDETVKAAFGPHLNREEKIAVWAFGSRPYGLPGLLLIMVGPLVMGGALSVLGMIMLTRLGVVGEGVASIGSTGLMFVVLFGGLFISRLLIRVRQKNYLLGLTNERLLVLRTKVPFTKKGHGSITVKRAIVYELRTLPSIDVSAGRSGPKTLTFRFNDPKNPIVVKFGDAQRERASEISARLSGKGCTATA